MRVTEKDLKVLVKILNDMTGSPSEPYSRTDSGLRANVGNYHLSGQYGGWSVQRMVNDGGGVKTVFFTDTKPMIYKQLQAFISGYEAKDHE